MGPGRFTYIHIVLVVNVGKYIIDGSYGNLCCHHIFRCLLNDGSLSVHFLKPTRYFLKHWKNVESSQVRFGVVEVFGILPQKTYLYKQALRLRDIP